MYQIIAYFKFLWKSGNQHGVHSPFVYSLVTRCFYDKKRYASYDMISRYRWNLLENSDSIEVTDLGAGSRVFRSSKRKIADIARTAGITKKRARLLNRLVSYLNVRQALELGTSVGIGTVAMAAGNEVRITSLEGCPNTAKVAQEQFQEFDLKNIELGKGEFKRLLSDLTVVQEDLKSAKTAETNPPLSNFYDLVFFDGNHQKQPTLEYFNTLLPLAHNDSVFIFDDIHWSREMTEVWEVIKAHPSVRVSIDTFFWGLVFFRKEQEKEHFVIRV